MYVCCRRSTYHLLCQSEEAVWDCEDDDWCFLNYVRLVGLSCIWHRGRILITDEIWKRYLRKFKSCEILTLCGVRSFSLNLAFWHINMETHEVDISTNSGRMLNKIRINQLIIISHTIIQRKQSGWSLLICDNLWRLPCQYKFGRNSWARSTFGDPEYRQRQGEGDYQLLLLLARNLGHWLFQLKQFKLGSQGELGIIIIFTIESERVFNVRCLRRVSL